MLRIILFLASLALTLCDYRVSNHTENSTSVVLNLQYTGNDTFYIKNTSTIYTNLTFTLTCHSYADLSLQITDNNNSRFRIPNVNPFPVDPLIKSTFPLNLSQFLFSYTTSPFHFRLIRKASNEILFDSSAGDLIFSKYYLEVNTRVASRFVWGLGERYSANFRLQTGKYTMWNKDKGERVDHTQGFETYGFYPAYLTKQKSGLFHMVHLRNSNAMDVIVANDNTTTYKLTYKIIGGMLDFRFILGDDNPERIVERFHSYLGRSAVPPFWGMGFHQSRWGYKNVSMLEDVIRGYEDNDIPLDTLWTDIDYMEEFEDFSIDETKFPLDRMAEIWSKYHMVPIIDAGIKVGNGSGYLEGQKMDVFIKDPSGQEARGFVWPGTTVFVDWFHPNATSYWVKMLTKLRQKYKFSGIWLDMNEISNFCDGPCVLPKGEKVFDYTHDIPYSPGSDTIESDTISMNNTHYGNISEADVHVFFGMMETYATHQFLQGIGLRPFIITRSSTFGSSKYGFHWTGDNVASWEFLKNTINQNFMFQLWGIQMVGPDICGYTLNTTEQLCARWFQLGSFYPFSRNHNDEAKIPQQAYALGPNVIEASRTNLKIRYSLLKEYYKHFVVQRGLGSIFRPLFFEFPADINTYAQNTELTQFLIGRSLMVAPVVVKGAHNRSVYFPAGQYWFNYHTGREHSGESSATLSNNMTEPVLMFIREGFVLFTQNTSNVTKVSHLNNEFHLLGAISYNNQSSTEGISRYTARGSLLSLGDYGDQSKLSLCLVEGCEYQMGFLVTIHRSGRVELSISTTYVGGKGLNSQQQIASLKFYYHSNKTLSHSFDPPLTIERTGWHNVTLSGDSPITSEQ